jgi:hypothetical protein
MHGNPKHLRILAPAGERYLQTWPRSMQEKAGLASFKESLKRRRHRIACSVGLEKAHWVSERDHVHVIRKVGLHPVPEHDLRLQWGNTAAMSSVGAT